MQRPGRGPRHDLVPLFAVALLTLAAPDGAIGAERPAAALRAQRLAREGDHIGAARLWEQAARDSRGAGAIAPLSMAAREWLQAERVADAERVAGLLAAAGKLDPRSSPGTQRGLVVAEVALAGGQPERALASLRALGEPPPPGAESAVLLLRGRSYAASGRVPEGLRALLARERLLPPTELAASRRQLWDALRAAAYLGGELRTPRGADAITAGWLELARLLPRARPAAAPTPAAVAAWRNRYPQHPAAALIAEPMPDHPTSPSAPSPTPAPTAAPPAAAVPVRPAATPVLPPGSPWQSPSPAAKTSSQVALLLPLSGRLGDAGEALRDGFMAAYYRQDEAKRPPVRIYDAEPDPAAAYRRALEDGAGFVVGPLGKENVVRVGAVADGRVPTLALNVLAEGEAVPKRFYQFALAPEDEARQVAERLLAEGKRTGVVLMPEGEWGARVVNTFKAAFTAGGGRVVTSLSYTASTTDFSDSLVPLLGFEDSQRRYRSIAGLVGGALQFTPRRRDDIEFVFFGGQPVQGRLVRPQLKFHYAGDLPLYSISDIFEPNPSANQDLEGVAFVDMPWMTADDAPLAELRASIGQLWPASARHRGRLFAMGYDAWQLAARLRSDGVPIKDPLAGLTGRLTVDMNGRVRRALDWSVIGTDGVPHPLPASGNEP